MTSVVPALEIGGSHVDGGLVDLSAGGVIPSSRHREPIPPDGTAPEILGAIRRSAGTLAASADRGATWGVAIPGPFDYRRGIGRYEDVGKFDALRGVNVRGALLEELEGAAADLVFLNDADAFLLGEWTAGAAAGHSRAAGVTLGTGVGSAFLADGVIVDAGPDVPPEGRLDLLTFDGRPFEETVSRRGILRRYGLLAGPALRPEVKDIAQRAREGERIAFEVLEETFGVLGQILGPWIARFDAAVLVVGGAMVGSWDLIERPLRDGIVEAVPGVAERVEIVPARLPDDAGMIGAARHSARLTGARAADEVTARGCDPPIDSRWTIHACSGIAGRSRDCPRGRRKGAGHQASPG